MGNYHSYRSDTTYTVLAACVLGTFAMISLPKVAVHDMTFSFQVGIL